MEPVYQPNSVEEEHIRQNMTRAEENLVLLQSLIPPSEKLYVWSYDPQGALIASSCPEEIQPVLDQTFRVFGGPEHLRSYAEDPSRTRPEIIGSPLGLQWALTYESDRSRRLLFVIGPVFYTAPSYEQLRGPLHTLTNTPEAAAWAAGFRNILPGLPVMSYAIFTRYVLLVHNTLSGQHLDLDALETAPHAESSPGIAPTGRDRRKVYQAERALLQMVREGDISYQHALLHSSGLSPGVPVQGKDPLRQVKTSIVVFITLVTRAAMEGGLSPEIAYPLGDSYLQAVEDCRDSGELSALSHAMYHDFIYRVHHVRSNPDYSPAIQKCCDYIELSLDRTVSTADLAALAGYSEYYLSEKFKKETGRSLRTYIRDAKAARAKVLLETTDLSVREISDHLAYNTVNYFIQSFRESTGQTPARYRKEHR
ncbi:MAG: helix-turn-helix domain-containing protein [Lachnospiraceae bacterium]|nr:helix-turn-helix domain-containing protein [Lachnospiraceae bacterium]